MERLLAIVAASMCATGAIAQAHVSTVAMSCGQAAALVATHGAAVLGTGGYTYDRFVADGRFCVRGEITEPAWVPSGDTAQCFVGYRCKQPVGRVR
jgi:opacity protein-like surface antigen